MHSGLTPESQRVRTDEHPGISFVEQMANIDGNVSSEGSHARSIAQQAMMKADADDKLKKEFDAQIHAQNQHLNQLSTVLQSFQNDQQR